MQAPSTLWLLSREALLMKRDLSRLRRKVTWILAIVFIGMHALGFGMLRALRRLETTETQFTIMLALALGFIFVLMLAKALTSAVHAVHGRRDLDLLFAAPVPPHRIVAMRMTSVAFGTALPFLFLVAPFVNVLILAGHWRHAGVYAVIGAFALVTTVIGLVLALGLLQLVGPRRTEIAAQIVGAVFGALAFLLSQSKVLLSDETREAFWLAFFEKAAQIEKGAAPVWMWPGEAAAGDPGALAIVLLGATVFFVVSIRLVAPAVAWWARASYGAPSRIDVAPRRAGDGEIAFRPGIMRALFVKELRLLLRNPLTVFHTLMKSLYLAPLVVVALRAQDPMLGVAAVAGLVVAITLQLASALASNTISGEDARDLLSSAPVSLRRLRGVKIAAALTPVLLLALAASLALAFVSPSAAFWTLALSLIASAAAAQLQLWHEEPPNRTDLRRRQHDLSALTFVETGLTIAFGAAAFFAVRGSHHAVWGVGAAALLMLVLAPRAKEKTAQA